MRAPQDVWLRVEGRPMYARRWDGPQPGNALPVVLVHGLGMSGRYMIPTAVRLAKRSTVYAVDLPGHGRSARPPHAQGPAAQARSLAAWLIAAGIPRAVLLGNSLGCQTIVALASQHPERVAAAILVAPTMDPRAPTVLALALRLIWDGLGEAPGLVWVGGTDYLRAGPWRVLQTLRAALRESPLPYLPAVTCPVLVVIGTRDRLVSVPWSRTVAAHLPRARLAELPGAPHAVNYSRPGVLARAVRPFLRTLGEDGAPPPAPQTAISG